MRTASRVLPTPPGPTRLIRRAPASFLLASASSYRRPTKLGASAGRLPDRWVSLATPRTYYGALPLKRSCKVGGSTGSVLPRMAAPATGPTVADMSAQLPVHQVEVSFVGTPPASQIERASDVSGVEQDGP